MKTSQTCQAASTAARTTNSAPQEPKSALRGLMQRLGLVLLACTLVAFPSLTLVLSMECGAQDAVLDGEIVCLDKTGTSQFRNLRFRRGEPRYYAFDLLYCIGEDLRYLPLADRKLCCMA
jgi:hypothetical protein